MDELSFYREQLRREAQSLVNACDAAIGEEGEETRHHRDIVLSAHTITCGMASKQLIGALMKQAGVEPPNGEGLL